MSDGNEKLYDFVARSNESAVKEFDPSKTVQSDLEDSDINTIVRRFNITGQIPQGLRLPEYGDYDAVMDYQSALHALMDAEDNFMSIPGEIRAKFDHDPGKYLDFVSNPDNLEALREMGLAKPVPVEFIPAGDVDAAK